MVFVQQRVLRLHHIRVQWNAFNGAHLHALWLIKMSNTFGAFMGIDLVDLFTKINGLVGTLGFADITVDALTGDHQSHGKACLFFLLIKKSMPGESRQHLAHHFFSA
jgi:hypothetical protein